MNRTGARPFDSSLRFMVPSNRKSDAEYLVELDAYNGVGKCCCAHFEMRIEPLLRRMIPEKEAIAKGLLKLKPGRHVEDLYRCEHLITARNQFADQLIKAIHDAETKNTPEKNRMA